jgi:flagellar biosynthetic protein FliR
MTGLFVIAPIFGRNNIPRYFKVGFSFFTALILATTTGLENIKVQETILAYALLIIKEFLVGLSIGFIAYISYNAIYIAGEIIDMHIGFGMVSVLDPVSNIQVPVTSNIYFIISMLLFLLINGHHMLIKALFNSFATLPIGTAVFDASLADGLMEVFSAIFSTGFKIAAPVIAATFMCEIALGTISRMVPQLNIFVVGMPLKIVIGLVVLLLTIPIFVNVMESIFGTMQGNILDYIEELKP